jgi:NAD(P)-dependent dehydrogenase (short-subunit alcohol dehydrogenase family)
VAGRLNGKIAIVTGGGRGIGQAVAKAFSRQGATVVVADYGVGLDGTGSSNGPAQETVDEIQAAGGSAQVSVTDVGDAEQARKLIQQTVERFGRLDILVNAAGILGHGGIADVTEQDFDQVMRVNLKGTFNTTRYAARHWRAVQAGGRLINVGSDAGFYGVPEEIAYATSKAGLEAFTLSCAGSLRDVGVTCNVVHPQALTRLTGSIPIEQRPDPERWLTDEFNPAKVAPGLIYLASDEGAWITGRTLACFGYEIHLYSTPARVRSLFSPGPWDLDVLFDRFRPVFG